MSNILFIFYKNSIKYNMYGIYYLVLCCEEKNFSKKNCLDIFYFNIYL